MKRSVLLCVSAIAIASSTSVAAQTTSTAPENEVPGEADSNDTSDLAISSNDIIVTATKRQLSLQDTPVSVSVTTVETIEQAHVRDILDLQAIVPSLRVDQLQSSANTNFIIRGFGNGANNAGIEPSVAVFIDGVYRSRSAAQIANLPNVERVEVLRGPQSTLFGKNASAGVISLVTQKPQFDFSGFADATYGNYNAVLLKAGVTGPINDTIAFSLAGNFDRADGYARDVNLNRKVNDRNRYGIRGQILFQPSNDFSVRLIGDYDDIDENCCIAANVLAGPTEPLVNAIAGGRAYDANNPFSYTVFNDLLSTNRIKNYGGSAEINYNLGALSLTSISAYREVRSFTNQDSDFTAADLIGRNSSQTDINTFTQEVRLTSDFDGPVNFLLGGFFFDERIKVDNTISFGNGFRPYGDALIQTASGGGLSVPVLETFLGAFDGTNYAGQFFRAGDGMNERYKYKDRAVSAFGSVDFKPTDSLTLSGGFNYTDDRKRVTTDIQTTDVFSRIDLDAPQYAPFRAGILVQNGIPAATAAALSNNPAFNPLAGLKPFQFLPPFLNIPNAVENGRTGDSKFTYTLRAAYKLNRSLNFYATYATGFKASSFNLSRDSRPLAGDIPAILSGGFATPNLAAGTRFASPENSDVYEVGIKGSFPRVAFNFDVFQQSIKGFQGNAFVGTGFVLTNAGKQSTFGIEFDGTVTPVDPLTLFLAITYLNPKYDSYTNSAAGDLTGTTPANIPPISMTIGGTFTQPISDQAKLILRGSYHYESKAQIIEGLSAFGANAVAAARPYSREINQVDASATLQIGAFDLSVFGRNLTNDRYLTIIFDSVVQQGSISGYPSRPRTYGASIGWKF
jgi:iron complex outermembrane recepter protein